MVGMAYAAVLYSWFCKTTASAAFRRSPVRAAQISTHITVRSTPMWARIAVAFEPERTSIEVRLGEVVTIYYTVTTVGAGDRRTGAYNVSRPRPELFRQINCFCFTEQRLAPGEKREMAVVFYVDPSHEGFRPGDLNTSRCPTRSSRCDRRGGRRGRRNAGRAGTRFRAFIGRAPWRRRAGSTRGD